MMRTSTLTGCVFPRRSITRSCSTRSSLTWTSIGKSPISSRKSVDWLAASNRPICRESAPVYAPLSRPNSSLSMRAVGMAAQLTRIIWPLMARAQVVNRLRHHFLARSGFAEQQDGGGRGRDLFDLREHLSGWRRFPRPIGRDVLSTITSSAKFGVLQRQAIAQPAELVERLLQRFVAGTARKRLAHDAGNQTQMFDDGWASTPAPASSNPAPGRSGCFHRLRLAPESPRLRIGLRGDETRRDRDRAVRPPSRSRQDSPAFSLATTNGIDAVGNGSGSEDEGRTQC